MHTASDQQVKVEKTGANADMEMNWGDEASSMASGSSRGAASTAAPTADTLADAFPKEEVLPKRRKIQISAETRCLKCTKTPKAGVCYCSVRVQSGNRELRKRVQPTQNKLVLVLKTGLDCT